MSQYDPGCWTGHKTLPFTFDFHWNHSTLVYDGQNTKKRTLEIIMPWCMVTGLTGMQECWMKAWCTRFISQKTWNRWQPLRFDIIRKDWKYLTLCFILNIIIERNGMSNKSLKYNLFIEQRKYCHDREEICYIKILITVEKRWSNK